MQFYYCLLLKRHERISKEKVVNTFCHIKLQQGATENTGVENAGASKIKGLKSREWKSWHQKAGVKNAGETSMESQNSRSLTLLSSGALD